MRKMWKTALAITFVLGFWGAAAQAQPLIAGNAAAFGNPPINTWDFLGVPGSNQVGSFIPQGAVGVGTNIFNGRGIAVGGANVYYTELSGADSYGPTDKIRITPFNAGIGATTDIGFFNNPRPDAGIQDLTFSNSILYALTGYPDKDPIVYGLNLGGAVVHGPVPIPFPASTDSDGFAVLPDTLNYLVNRGDTSCIYDEYSSVDGHFIGRTINVPGNGTICTGVDTDGTSLFFMTDFNSITKTDLFGNLIGFVTVQGTYDTEDISLIHPVTSITHVDPAHLFFTLKTTDDIGTKFDFQVELLKNGAVVASGVGLCKTIVRNLPGSNTEVPINLPADVSLVSGDVLGARVSTRIGTAVAPATCPGHVTATGVRFFYDSTNAPSQFSLTIFPNPPAALYFHSDGVPCSNIITTSDSGSTVAGRILSDIPSVAANPKCQNVGTVDGRTLNPWMLFGTWNLAPLP